MYITGKRNMSRAGWVQQNPAVFQTPSIKFFSVIFRNINLCQKDRITGRQLLVLSSVLVAERDETATIPFEGGVLPVVSDCM